MNALLLLAAALFLLPGAAAAQDDEVSDLSGRAWHVAPGGSNANPGTLEQPLRTVQAGVNRAQPADTVLVHAGVYHEAVKIQSSGIIGARIRLLGAGDGVAEIAPTLSPRTCDVSSPTRDRAVMLVEGSDNWTIRRLKLTGGVLVQAGNVEAITGADVRDRTLPGRAVNDPIAAILLLPLLGVDPADNVRIMENDISRRGILTSGARYGRISGNEIHDIECGTGAGMWINRFSDGWLVVSNYVHHVADSDHHFMSEGIRMGSGSSYNVIEDNLVEDLAGDGRGIAVDVFASWNVIRGNVVRRAAIGINEQAAGWGNHWLANETYESRRFGMIVGGQYRDLTSPSDQVPAFMEVRCNVAHEAKGLMLGGSVASAFADNSFPSVDMTRKTLTYWSEVGNTWDGSSTPPPENPPQVTCP